MHKEYSMLFRNQCNFLNILYVSITVYVDCHLLYIYKFFYYFDRRDAASNIVWYIFRWNCAFFNNSSLEMHTQYARQRKRKPDLSTFPNKCLITHIRDRGRNTIPRPFLPPAPSSSLHLSMFIFYSWTLGLPPLFSLIALRAPSIPSSLMREQRKATKTARYSLARARAATLFPRLLAHSHPPVLIFHRCLRGGERARSTWRDVTNLVDVSRGLHGT